MNKIIHILFFGFLFNMNAQTTYTVTSTSITGPGSFTEAISLANANAGADIIEFTPGLQVDASVASVTPSTSIMAHITESVLIDGKDGSLNGIQMWIDVSGQINSLSFCPGEDPNGNTIQSAYMPGFVEIGTPGQDNSGIDVSIKNLTIKQFNQVAVINENASLEFENFTALETWATFECLNDQMIIGRDGVSLTIKDSEFMDAVNWADPGILAAAISVGPDGGDLTIEGSVFKNLYDDDNVAIWWRGKTGSEVNIVSSRFQRSGGIFNDGESEANIVNTIWTNYYILEPEIGDLFVNQSSGDMNLIASSFVFNSNECDGICQTYQGFDNLFEIAGSGNINFIQSAVGFNWDPTGTVALNTLGINGGSGVFTADIYTWIQATSQQDDAALKTITGQSALLTNLFGFNREVIASTLDWDVEMATPAFPGELIDVIPTGNPLINPNDNSTITLDVAGNPREDANGERDIGALQLGLAPFLAVSNSGDELVALSWNEPLHHDGQTIIRYELVYDQTGGSNPTTVSVDASSTGHTVGGLTNGAEYEFKIRAIYDGEIEGPFSNTVTETPYGPIDTPTVSAVPTDGEVTLSWNLPDLGGNQFSAYVLKWRIGSGNFIGAIGFTDINTLSYTVTGLTNGTEYEFSISISTFGGVGPASIINATPTETLSTGVVDIHELISYYPNPVNDALNIVTNEKFRIRIFSSIGSLLIETKNEKTINFSHLKNGFYFIQIEVGGKILTDKLIKR
ncbi:fibronectin type III domain-containing protein [Seonamhaeicola maritimus]|uniref:T9SS type A sorting domain-containing protein n=1 Tax=Seonamhaeicola maritimus TaxID=2591822 RepID=A0A5C7GDK6_9FLAO|nr:fibronectin type III domain-containing protein [Seonamhaeicola maritimus]TXG34837.1 T9SS type A sorting domain-containing protein [Seonamhaeicola maritimus]